MAAFGGDAFSARETSKELFAAMRCKMLDSSFLAVQRAFVSIGDHDGYYRACVALIFSSPSQIQERSVDFRAGYRHRSVPPFAIFQVVGRSLLVLRGNIGQSGMAIGNPTLTGVPVNGAYRYMDWLLTVPLL